MSDYRNKAEKAGRLLARLRTLHSPVLAKDVGDIMLYESLLAGLASRLSGGHQINTSAIPLLDEDTLLQIRILRKKDHKTPEEKYFLEYLGLLEEIRSVLAA